MNLFEVVNLRYVLRLCRLQLIDVPAYRQDIKDTLSATSTPTKTVTTSTNRKSTCNSQGAITVSQLSST